MNKAICIGFHKTGTSSIGRVFRLLGIKEHSSYKPRDQAFVEKLRLGDLDELLEVAASADALRDNPWPLFYRELDNAFPDSRFILTVRDTQSWIRSVSNHFGNQENPHSPMREWIYGYGTPTDHATAYIERYERHQREVAEYFSGRENDLLTVDLSKGDPLKSICRFLGRRKPWFKRMPHKNRRLT